MWRLTACLAAAAGALRGASAAPAVRGAGQAVLRAGGARGEAADAGAAAAGAPFHDTCAAGPRPIEFSEDTFHAFTLAVGQGDCHVHVCPPTPAGDVYATLLDSGMTHAKAASQAHLNPSLDHLGASLARFRAVHLRGVLTHPHQDHVNTFAPSLVRLWRALGNRLHLHPIYLGGSWEQWQRPLARIAAALHGAGLTAPLHVFLLGGGAACGVASDMPSCFAGYEGVGDAFTEFCGADPAAPRYTVVRANAGDDRDVNAMSVVLHVGAGAAFGLVVAGDAFQLSHVVSLDAVWARLVVSHMVAMHHASRFLDGRALQRALPFTARHGTVIVSGPGRAGMNRYGHPTCEALDALGLVFLRSDVVRGECVGLQWAWRVDDVRPLACALARTVHPLPSNVLVCERSGAAVAGGGGGAAVAGGGGGAGGGGVGARPH